MSESIGREFMRKTQYQYMGDSAQSRGEPQPPLELPYDVTQRPVDLPAPNALQVPPVDLRALIEDRITVRQYASQPLTLEELSYLLWCTQGVKKTDEKHITRRTVPSAGSRHAFETLLLINRVDGLEPGLYRYVASLHKLVRLEAAPDIDAQIMAACGDQPMVKRSAVTFIWVAVAERMTWRYNERAYRYMLLDAGHVCQNLYLAGWALDCGTCAIAAYSDDELNGVLELDGETAFVIYLGTVGKRP
jgi:SagB-type dehydrogenase family enzyme